MQSRPAPSLQSTCYEIEIEPSSETSKHACFQWVGTQWKEDETDGDSPGRKGAKKGLEAVSRRMAGLKRAKYQEGGRERKGQKADTA